MRNSELRSRVSVSSKETNHAAAKAIFRRERPNHILLQKTYLQSDSANEPIGNLSYVKKSFHEYVLAHRAQRGAPQFRIPNSEFRIDVLILARKEETRYYAKL